ncbi:hypothetical protein, partial [Klebsiella aerogenes]|uniref:hypothetical protein n=1 Tax=Klebsiella aerogenes TaxID=548 RepID=UPI001BCB8A46
NVRLRAKFACGKNENRAVITVNALLNRCICEQYHGIYFILSPFGMLLAERYEKPTVGILAPPPPLLLCNLAFLTKEIRS